MNVLSTLTKSIKTGTSTWFFCQTDNTFFAINGDLKVIKTDGRDGLRNLYQNFIKYGYSIPTVQMEIPLP